MPSRSVLWVAAMWVCYGVALAAAGARLWVLAVFSFLCGTISAVRA